MRKFRDWEIKSYRNHSRTTLREHIFCIFVQKVKKDLNLEILLWNNWHLSDESWIISNLERKGGKKLFASGRSSSFYESISRGGGNELINYEIKKKKKKKEERRRDGDAWRHNGLESSSERFLIAVAQEKFFIERSFIVPSFLINTDVMASGRAGAGNTWENESLFLRSPRIFHFSSVSPTTPPPPPIIDSRGGRGREEGSVMLAQHRGQLIFARNNERSFFLITWENGMFTRWNSRWLSRNTNPAPARITIQRIFTRFNNCSSKKEAWSVALTRDAIRRQS